MTDFNQVIRDYRQMVTNLESPPQVIMDQVGAKGHDGDDPKAQLTARLLHVGMGMVTEAGEIMDQLKKHIVYGRPLDVVNIKEELGDELWYVMLGCIAMEIDFIELLVKNMDKLRVRYPDKFDFERQINRDLDAERGALEGDAGAASRTTCNNLPNS